MMIQSFVSWLFLLIIASATSCRQEATAAAFLLIIGAKQNGQAFSFTGNVISPSIISTTLLFADNGKKLSQADEERLLLTEPALNAFIVAEMEHFVTESLTNYDKGYFSKSQKWKMNYQERLTAGIITEMENGTTVVNEDYVKAQQMVEKNGTLAVDWICNATQAAFRDGFNNEQGLLSALGSAILFFRDFFRTPQILAACERVGLSDYAVAHHITDMYHHRNFRGAYTKTLAPSGRGEIASRSAVGLPPVLEKTHNQEDEMSKETANDADNDEDECLLWSPTTPGVCIHWKSEDEAWRKRRFEKIQMEGTRDPRRGGSGTTR